jgi:predicted TIM-barrel fold metal-dependent hydrolase
MKNPSALADTKRGNPQMAGVVAEHPDRFRAYWVVNPNYPGRVKEEIEAYPGQKGFVGFKFLSDYHKVAITDDRYKPLLEFARDRRLIILMHTWGGSPYDSPALVRSSLRDRMRPFCPHN